MRALQLRSIWKGIGKQKLVIADTKGLLQHLKAVIIVAELQCDAIKTMNYKIST